MSDETEIYLLVRVDTFGRRIWRDHILEALDIEGALSHTLATPGGTAFRLEILGVGRHPGGLERDVEKRRRKAEEDRVEQAAREKRRKYSRNAYLAKKNKP